VRYGVFGCKREKLNKWELLITVTVTQKKNTTRVFARDAGHVVTRSLSLWEQGAVGKTEPTGGLACCTQRPHG